ncbi:MAG: beta-glucosidase BglX, partial [bacterium]
MKIKKRCFIFLFFLLSAFGLSTITLSKNSNIEDQIEALLLQMTLEEKIGQLTQVSGVNENYLTLLREGKIGSFLNIRGAKKSNELQKIAIDQSRLGIPLILGNDVIHGYRTIFPIPLGEASTWDPALVQQAAAVAAEEASAAGTHWTFAPMVDIARDPRWGRIAEGTGEDPYLGSVMARAKVKGFQGNNLADPATIVACPKHYVAYGAAEAGKDYNTVDISLRTLREVYLPPFKTAIEAGAGTLMSAFNELNGIPTSANHYTLTQILREEWDFKGFVVSDWNAITELLNHGIAGTPAEAGRKALMAGVDMDMMGFVYINNLANLVKEGQLAEELIDDAVRRILHIKFRLGLFDRPYVDPKYEDSIMLSKENLETALEVARKSIVLLKNDNQLLPLSKEINSVAVIGPLANNRKAPLGCWSCEGRTEDVVTVLEGIKKKIPHERIHYAKGCEIEGNSLNAISEAVKIAKDAAVALVVIGESADMIGEASSRSSIDLPGLQKDLVKAIYETGTPTIVVLMNGRPLTIPWIAEHVPAILETWFLGVQSGNAIADVIFGDFNPGGKLPVTFPRTVGQVPIYYNHKNTGRPPSNERYTSKYLDLPVTPLFPFGYGLSYTKFKYDDLRISIKENDNPVIVTVSVEVQNVGDRTGDEVVQLYIRDLVGSITRPVKELKGFRRITL